jgi:hypothetical protein
VCGCVLFKQTESSRGSSRSEPKPENSLLAVGCIEPNPPRAVDDRLASLVAVDYTWRPSTTGLQAFGFTSGVQAIFFHI